MKKYFFVFVSLMVTLMIPELGYGSSASSSNPDPNFDMGDTGAGNYTGTPGKVDKVCNCDMSSAGRHTNTVPTLAAQNVKGMPSQTTDGADSTGH